MERREAVASVAIQECAVSGFFIFVFFILLLAVPIWLLGDVMHRERGRPGFSPRVLFWGAYAVGVTLLALVAYAVFISVEL